MSLEDKKQNHEFFRLHHYEEDPFNQKRVFTEEVEEKTHEPQEKIKAPRSLKEVLQDGGRQLFASLVILVIGFFVMNAGSFIEIGKHEYYKLIGQDVSAPLTELTQDSKTIPRQASDDASNTGKIPALNLEIAPDDNRIIIPRINRNIPIVRVSSEKLLKRDWKGLEKDMQEALQGGVVHYPGTSLPNQKGNVVITGHSSYFPWDPGRFKDVFVLLHEVVKGDQIIVYYEQKKYTYEVADIKTVLPDDISILKQTTQDQITLITCTPVGTNLKRLIVTAKLVKMES